MANHTPVFKCSYGNLEVDIPLQSDLDTLLEYCAAAFRLQKHDIIGFTSGDHVYPASLVGLSKPNHFAGKRMQLLVDFRGESLVMIHQYPNMDIPDPEQEISKSTPLTDTQHEDFQVKFYLIGGDIVGMARTDLMNLGSLCERFIESSVDCKSLMQLMMTYMQIYGPVIDENTFENLIEEHMSYGEASETVDDLLWRIFAAFSDDNQSRALSMQLFSGLVFLCTCSSKMKFAHLFQFYAKAGDVQLEISRRNVVNIVQSSLTIALAVVSSMAGLSREYIHDQIVSTSEFIWESIYEYVASDTVPYAAFMDWYRSEGRSLMPWCEILGSPTNIEKLLTLYHDSDDDEVPVFRFNISNGIELVIKQEDVDYVESICVICGIHMISLDKLQLAFRNVIEHKKVEKDDYDDCIRALLPGFECTEAEQQQLSYAFSTLFYAFDRSNSQTAATDELMSGLAMLCRGDKSEKLAMSFNLFDEDDIGLLSFLNLFRYLRSFLTVLFALRTDAPTLDAEPTYNAIDEAASQAAFDIFEHCNKGHHDGISFEEFGDWYNEVGHQDTAWIELVSLAKWPFSQLEIGSSYDEEDEAEDGTTLSVTSSDEFESDDESDGSPATVIFHISLSPGGETLDIDQLDLDHFEDLFRCPPKPYEAIVQILGQTFDKYQVSKTQFLTACHRILTNDPIDEQPGMDFTGELLKCFALFDTGHGYAPLDEIMCALLLLGEGNKSDKLIHGFALFDQQRKGTIPASQMTRFFRALLLGIYGFTHKVNSMAPEEIIEIASNSVRKIVSLFETGVDLSFETFAAWYSDQGYTIMPWIELYDIHKWPVAIGGQKPDDMETANAEEPLCVYHLRRKLAIRLNPNPVKLFTDTAYNTQLVNASPEELNDILIHNASDIDGVHVIVASEFESLLNEILSKCPDNNTTRKSITQLIEMIQVFSRDDGGGIVASKLLSGMVVYTAGTIQEKMDYLFEVFNQSGMPFMSPADLHTCLLSILKGIVCISKQSLTDSQAEALDDYVSNLVSSVFNTTSRESEDEISFEEFDGWYSTVGSEIAPWLELLEVKTWSNLLEDIEDDDQAVFKFFLSEIDKENMVLTLSANDVGQLRKLVKSSDFVSLSPSDVVKAFHTAFITKAQYDGIIRSLTSHLKLDYETKVFLSGMLSSLFVAFDRDQRKRVDGPTIVSSFLIFVDGSKSEKLNMAWSCFDVDKTNRFSRARLTKFLEAFLTTLFVLSEEARSHHSAIDMWKLVEEWIDYVVDLVFAYVEPEGDLISFEEFASFYSSGGNKYLTWLELLNLHKWVLEE